MTSLALLTAFLGVVAPSSELVQLPSDVTSFVRGAGAVGVDPAAAGRLDGVELQLRDHGTQDVRGMGALGAYVAVPIGSFSLVAGYEWNALPDPSRERLTVGASLALAPEFRFGLSYHALWPNERFHAGMSAVWDAGFLVEANRYVSVSMGVDAINAPTFDDGTELHRDLRVGMALRPWHGDPAITLAGDSRMVVTDQPQAISTRAIVDISPWEGVHLWSAYEHKPNNDAVWAGVTLAAGGAEVSGSSRVNSDTGSFWDNSALAVTLRTNAQESLVRPRGRTVEILLEGDLQAHEGGLFATGKLIPTAVLELDVLARDATVARVLLPVNNLKVGMGTIDELRAAIARLRAAGKDVVAQLQGGDAKTYLVAAAATRVRLDPAATLNLHGFAISTHYFASPLAKIGVRFDSVGVGKYKSGPDPLTRDTPRPEDREVEAEILNLAYSTLTTSLKVDRNLNDARVHEVLESGLIDAPQALAWGLVDEVSPSADPHAIPPLPSHGIPFDDTRVPSSLWSARPIIAVVPIVGAIAPSRGDNPLPGVTAESHRIVPQLDSVAGDPAVRAVVVRINSPGGDVFASEMLWRSIRRVAAVKPVIISMGDVAASGGYYAAVAGHTILAQPNTITGSIGIFMVKPDISGLLEHIGVHRETYTAGEHADWESIEHGLSETDHARLERSLTAYYNTFIGRVAAGRKLTTEVVRELAEGRVYTAAHARELGLVDGFGGLDDAVRLACERAHVSLQEADVVIPDRDLSLPEVAQRLMSAAAQSPLEALQNDVLGRVQALENRALAIMPYAISVQTP